MPAFRLLEAPFGALNQTVARSDRAPGGWGAEESGTPTEPGPEATGYWFAF